MSLGKAAMRQPNPRLTYAVAIPALGACIAFAVASPHDTLLSPLTLALAACAVCASTAYVPLEGRLLVDATFVPLLLAIAFLGPAATFLIVVASELGAWSLQRYRPVVVPINLVAVGGIAMLGAAWFQALSSDPGPVFFALLAATGAVTLLVNDVVITSLVGVLDGAPIRRRLAGHKKLIPALAINVVLGVVAASIYLSAGLEVLVLVCGLIVGFNYMVRQTLQAREHAERSRELLLSRERLLTQTLDTEARERRVLAESLHDGALQTLMSALQDLGDAADGNPGAARRAREAVEQTRREIRAAVYELHPMVLQRAGLGSALEEMVRRTAERARFDYVLSVAPEVAGLDDRLLLSMVRELVSNAAKHAAARSVDVSISVQSAGLVVQVSDDGRGFSESAYEAAIAAGHIGLATCHERCLARDGSLSISSDPASGTTVRAVIPIGSPEALASTGAPSERGMASELASVSKH